MQRLHNGIDANALTGLQGAWGGTHDALLGLLLWMYRVPSYSLNRCASTHSICYTCMCEPLMLTFRSRVDARIIC
jgi:hypothetical protein